jgi:Holliday junction resolvase RusA-like endonuclease
MSEALEPGVGAPAVVGEFFVPGRCRTKGSLKANGTTAGGRTRLVESTELSKPWKIKMIRAILRSRLAAGPLSVTYPEPVEVRCEFLFDREVGVRGKINPSSATAWPISIIWGDLDKFLRNLLDALTQSRLIKDDSLVVSIRSRKRWTRDGEQQGVTCTVLAVGDE